jgi:hypothetical protein
LRDFACVFLGGLPRCLDAAIDLFYSRPNESGLKYLLELLYRGPT